MLKARGLAPRPRRLALAVVTAVVLLVPASHARSDGKGEGSVLISAADLHRHRASRRDLVLVDVRQAESFRSLRIPGSLNIPLFALKTTSFLKEKDVILVNEGFLSSDLEAVSRSLVVGGMRSVRVLDGGIASWAAHGGALSGDPASLREIRTVSPGAFAAERGRRHLPVIVTGVSEEEARRHLPEAEFVPFGEGEGFLARLERVVPAAGGARTTTVVMVDKDGGLALRAQSLSNEQRFQQSHPAVFFFLEGGLEGYQAYRERQVALLKGKEKLSAGGCPDCPQGGGR